MSFFSAHYFYSLYQKIMVQAACSQLAATCYYLSACARTRAVQTSLCISDSRKYVTRDGNEQKEHMLPLGVRFGVSGLVYGPPSRPVRQIKETIVGGAKSENGVTLLWDSTGAATPATCYMYAGKNCCAVSMSRALVGRPAQWQLVSGLWQAF